MDGTIVCSGTFVSDNLPRVIAVPADYDYIHIRNFTVSSSLADNRIFDFYWQKGMSGIMALRNKLGAVTTEIVTSQMIQKYDFDTQPLVSVPYPIISITNANKPRLNFSIPSGQLGIAPGDVIRIYGSEQLSTNGVEWRLPSSAISSVDLVPDQTPLANPPGNVATKGFFVKIKYGALYRPTTAIITNITPGNPAAITTSVFHGLAPGCIIRFNIPDQCGMTELNSNILTNYAYYTVQLILTGYSFTINADTTNFTRFTWVTTQNISEGSQFPSYTVVGQNTADTLTINSFPETNDILSDTVENVQLIGAYLTSGITTIGPEGSQGDVMYWTAGKVMYEE